MGLYKDGYSPQEPSYDEELASSILPQSSEDMARLVADFHPATATPLAAADAVSSIRKGDYVGAGISSLGAIPVLGGLIKRAPDDVLRKAISAFRAFVNKGVPESAAHKIVFNTSGVDVLADRNFNYEIGGPSTGVQSPASRVYDEPLLGNTRIIPSNKIRNTVAEYSPDSDTIYIRPAIMKNSRQFKAAVDHEAQHALDRKLPNNNNYFKNYDEDISSYTHQLESINNRMKTEGVSRELILERAVVLRKKAIRNLSSSHEIRARATSSQAHIKLSDRDTINSRLIKEFNNTDALLANADKNVGYAQRLLQLSKGAE